MALRSILTSQFSDPERNINDSHQRVSQASLIFFQGGNQTGKTSLAFQLAYDEASCGGVPLFICQKERVELSFPLKVEVHNDRHIAQHGESTWNSVVLSRIHMKYISTTKELITLLGGLHVFKPLPTLIVLDDLGSWIDPSLKRNHDQKMVDSYLFLLGIIEDSVHCLKKIHQSKAQPENFRMIVLDNNEENAVLHCFQHSCEEIISFHQNALQSVDVKRIYTSRLSSWRGHQQSPPDELVGRLSLSSAGHLVLLHGTDSSVL